MVYIDSNSISWLVFDTSSIKLAKHKNTALCESENYVKNCRKLYVWSLMTYEANLSLKQTESIACFCLKLCCHLELVRSEFKPLITGNQVVLTLTI